MYAVSKGSISYICTIRYYFSSSLEQSVQLRVPLQKHQIPIVVLRSFDDNHIQSWIQNGSKWANPSVTLHDHTEQMCSAKPRALQCCWSKMQKGTLIYRASIHRQPGDMMTNIKHYQHQRLVLQSETQCTVHGEVLNIKHLCHQDILKSLFFNPFKDLTQTGCC